MNTISYKMLNEEEIRLSLFSNFDRYQKVKKCWRKENKKWILKDVSFTEQWDKDNYKSLVQDLKNTINTGGYVYGAFKGNKLIGFASLESKFFGSNKEYLQLSSIHVSKESRGAGIGKKLFKIISVKAKDMGAKKLYISAQSSKETQAFYKTLGCIEAEEYNESLVAKEPYDCQLEYIL